MTREMRLYLPVALGSIFASWVLLALVAWNVRNDYNANLAFRIDDCKFQKLRAEQAYQLAEYAESAGHKHYKTEPDWSKIAIVYRAIGDSFESAFPAACGAPTKP